MAPTPPSTAYRAVLPNQLMYVPSSSTSSKSIRKLWKNSKGRANQKPNVPKIFAWVFVELMMIQAIGTSVKIAKSTQQAVITETVPRFSP